MQNLNHTAGSAKNAIPKTQKQEATILPSQVLGTLSPFLLK
jgi:hypothetical protein